MNEDDMLDEYITRYPSAKMRDYSYRVRYRELVRGTHGFQVHLAVRRLENLNRDLIGFFRIKEICEFISKFFKR